MLKQSGEVFLKFNEEFIYISKINNGQNTAQNIKIFNIKDLNFSSFIEAQSGVFERENWTIIEGNISFHPIEYGLGD